MAKRFTDTNKYKDPWFRNLPPEMKILFYFMCDDCDHAGIWKENFFMFNAYFNLNLSHGDMPKFGKKIIRVNKETYFIVNFIKFQYGTLNHANNAHKGVLKVLDYYNLETSPYQGAVKPLGDPYQGALEKDMEKEKDMVKDILSNINLTKQSVAELNNSNAPTLDEVIQLWNETMTVGNKFYCRALPSDKLPLFAETTMKLKTLDGWKEVFEKAKQSKFLMGESKSCWRPSLDFYCNYNFVVKILNDGYLGMQKESEYEKWKREFMAQDANTNH